MAFSIKALLRADAIALKDPRPPKEYDLESPNVIEELPGDFILTDEINPLLVQ